MRVTEPVGHHHRHYLCLYDLEGGREGVSGKETESGSSLSVSFHMSVHGYWMLPLFILKKCVLVCKKISIYLY